MAVGDANPLPWIGVLLTFAVAFYLYPAVEVIRLSFTNSSLLRERYRYTLQTLQEVVSAGKVQDALWITLLFVVASVALQFLLGLGAALALHRGTMRRLLGTALVRSVVLTAWIMPGVVIGVVWRIVLSEASYGLVNSLIGTVGIPAVPFLSDRVVALWTIVVANAWRGAAFSMILQYAGLQAIPVELYEAAAVDGGGPLQVFRRVTLPQLRPIIAINLILATIGTMNTFDMILALTAGGPGRATEVLALFTYNTLFVDFDLSRAAALALIMLLLSLGFTLLYVRFLQEEHR